jgi:hypothetical protein
MWRPDHAWPACAVSGNPRNDLEHPTITMGRVSTWANFEEVARTFIAAHWVVDVNQTVLVQNALGNSGLADGHATNQPGQRIFVFDRPCRPSP